MPPRVGCSSTTCATARSRRGSARPSGFCLHAPSSCASTKISVKRSPKARRSHRPRRRAPLAHWEPYKNSATPPSVDQKLMDPVLDGAIDLHAHYGPDSYPRQWDAFEITAIAKERGLRAIVFKNHWSETESLAYLVRKYGPQGIDVYGAVTLDTPIGGVNPQAVRYMVDVTGGYGRIVWM